MLWTIAVPCEARSTCTKLQLHTSPVYVILVGVATATPTTDQHGIGPRSVMSVSARLALALARQSR